MFARLAAYIHMNKKGSAAILISMISVAIMLSVVAGLGVARRITLGSVTRSFGTIWTRAVLSEYDVYLFDEYGIMAYQGSDAEVAKKLDIYTNYSMAGKLGVDDVKESAELSQYSMGDVDNFRKAVRDSMKTEVIGNLIQGKKRGVRSKNTVYDRRELVNRGVISTLPSRGVGGESSIDSLIDTLKEGNILESAIDSGTDLALDMAFINMYLDNHLTTADNREKFFYNQWEYVIAGKRNDESNFKYCKNRIFLIRNGLNLVALSKDSEKMELITAAAELITPGPAGAVTTALIMEAWAALEAEEDVKALLNNERVPLIKTQGQWKISLSKVVNSDKVRGKLDEEAKELLDTNSGEIRELEDDNIVEKIKEGQNYSDYLRFMLLVMGSDLRTMRIMDIVQMDMKLRHYRDFNFEEYYIGVTFSLNSNGKTHIFKNEYK